MQRRLLLSSIATVLLFWGVNQPLHASDYLKAVTDVALRDSPRTGLLCNMGKWLGKIEEGEVIKDWAPVRSTCGLFFTYEFYAVAVQRNGQEVRGFVSKLDRNNQELFTLVKGASQ